VPKGTAAIIDQHEGAATERPTHSHRPGRAGVVWPGRSAAKRGLGELDRAARHKTNSLDGFRSDARRGPSQWRRRSTLTVFRWTLSSLCVVVAARRRLAGSDAAPPTHIHRRAPTWLVGIGGDRSARSRRRAANDTVATVAPSGRPLVESVSWRVVTGDADAGRRGLPGTCATSHRTVRLRQRRANACVDLARR
jgi:hypothetical protein